MNKKFDFYTKDSIGKLLYASIVSISLIIQILIKSLIPTFLIIISTFLYIIYVSWITMEHDIYPTENEDPPSEIQNKCEE